MLEMLKKEKEALEVELSNQDLDLEEVERKVEEYKASLIKELETNRDARVNLINVKLAYIDELLSKYETVEAEPVEEEAEAEKVEEEVKIPSQDDESEY